MSYHKERKINISERTASNKRGFTIMEMVISLGIFSVVMVSAVGIILIAQNGQLKVRNLQNVQDNIRFTLEYMTKELRTGERFELCEWQGNNNTKVVFINDLGARVAYQWNETALSIDRYEYDVLLPDCSNTDNTTIPTSEILTGGSITTEEVSVERFLFHERTTIGTDIGPSDGQPRLVISVRVRAKDQKTAVDTVMNLQATITQRVRDE